MFALPRSGISRLLNAGPSRRFLHTSVPARNNPDSGNASASSSSSSSSGTGGSSSSSSEPAPDPAATTPILGPLTAPQLTHLGFALGLSGFALALYYAYTEKTDTEEAAAAQSKTEELQQKKAKLKDKRKKIKEELEGRLRKKEECGKNLKDSTENRTRLEGELVGIEKEVEDLNLALGLMKSSGRMTEILPLTVKVPDSEPESESPMSEKKLRRFIKKSTSVTRRALEATPVWKQLVGPVQKRSSSESRENAKQKKKEKTETIEQEAERELSELDQLYRKAELSKEERGAERTKERLQSSRDELELVLKFTEENPRFVQALKDKLAKYEFYLAEIDSQKKTDAEEKPLNINQALSTKEKSIEERWEADQLKQRVEVVVREAEPLAAAMSELEAAIQGKDKARCGEALKICAEIGLELGCGVKNTAVEKSLGSLIALADILLSADKMLDNKMTENKDVLSFADSAGSGGVGELDSKLQEDQLALQDLSRGDLVNAVLLRTEQLAKSEKLAPVRLADELQSFRESFETRLETKTGLSEKLYQAEKFAKEKDLITEDLSNLLQESLDHLTEQWLLRQNRTLRLTRDAQLTELLEQRTENVLKMKSQFSSELENLAGDFGAVARVLEEDSDIIRRMKRLRRAQTLVEAAATEFEQERVGLREVLTNLVEKLGELQDTDLRMGSQNGSIQTSIQSSTAEIAFANLCRIAGAGLNSAGGAVKKPEVPAEGDSETAVPDFPPKNVRKAPFISEGEALQAFDSSFSDWRSAAFVENQHSIWCHFYGSVMGKLFMFSGEWPESECMDDPTVEGTYAKGSVVDQGLKCLHLAKRSIGKASQGYNLVKDMDSDKDSDTESSAPSRRFSDSSEHLYRAVKALDRIPLQCGFLKQQTEPWATGARELLTGQQVFRGLRAHITLMQEGTRLVEG